MLNRSVFDQDGTGGCPREDWTNEQVHSDDADADESICGCISDANPEYHNSLVTFNRVTSRGSIALRCYAHSIPVVATIDEAVGRTIDADADAWYVYEEPIEDARYTNR